MQLGNIPGGGITDVLFVVRRLQKDCRDKEQKLNLHFVDIERACDRVPRKVMEWVVKKKGLPKVIVSAMTSLYHCSL